jgi:hypothetical protein
MKHPEARVKLSLSIGEMVVVLIGALVWISLIGRWISAGT